MNNEKRLMLAVALSIVIIIGYQAYMRQFVRPTTMAHDLIHTAQPMTAAATQSVIEHKPLQQLDSPGIANIPEKTFILENKHIQAVVTDAGAAVKKLYLLDYEEDAGKPILLLPMVADQDLFLSTDFRVEGGMGQWEPVFSSSDAVSYSASSRQMRIVKEILLHKDSHIIELKINMQNTTEQGIIAQYTITNGFLDVPRGDMDGRYIGADILLDGTVHRQRPSNKTIGQGHIVTGSPQWVVTRGRYFSFIMRPAQTMQGAFIRSRSKQDIYTGLASNALSIPSGGSVQHNYLIYVGPNDMTAMTAFDPTAEQIIHYGVFHFIGRILLHGLHMFYRLTHNYGIAIMLLAFFISLIMMPLTRKSLHSMKEMQKIQPETEQIRKQFSDNPQKMNKEIIELYKRHKINPVGGCLPMLLQMPIFFSLYQVLLRSVELKGAQFLWINDLSAPDAAFALPHTLPIIGSHIHILPILMAIAMAVQQRLSQGGGAKMSDQQRMMAGIMPIMFGLIFYNMPSGLVLYWFTNTLFMLAIQEIVLKSRFFEKNI
jgi:YidC/Oxa1 family membrane protein insertase